VTFFDFVMGTCILGLTWYLIRPRKIQICDACKNKLLGGGENE
jgi:hypothetical protein